MPVAIVDTEQAALIEAALLMFEAALTARTERADPEAIISNSLKLQATKLADVRLALKQPDPPAYSELGPTLRKKADDLLWGLASKAPDVDKNALWSILRAVINAPDRPGA